MFRISTSFVDLGDQTVLDRKTGLVWQKADGDTDRTWEAAISYCDGLNLAGKSDWRLPNIRELESITDDSKSNPVIDITAIPGTDSASYWSSTTRINFTPQARLVYFANRRNTSTTRTAISIPARCIRLIENSNSASAPSIIIQLLFQQGFLPSLIKCL